MNINYSVLNIFIKKLSQAYNPMLSTRVSNIHEPLLLTHCLTHYSVSIASFRSIRTSGILIEDE